MNILFYVIGVCVLATAILNGTTAETSIHQIYVQTQFLTAVFLIGFGHLFTCINNQTKKEQKILPSEQERKAFEKEQIEKLNKQD